MIYKSYSLTASAAFLIFCTIVRWEPFVVRYLVAFLALLCPMIGLQLQKRTVGENGKESPLSYACLGTIVFICVLSLGNMYTYHFEQNTVYGARWRPIGYFVNQRGEYFAYADLCDFINEHGYQQIGLVMGENSYEYPFWVMLEDSAIRLEHVNVNNESSIYADTEFTPQCIILLGSQPDSMILDKTEYSVIEKYDDSHCILVPTD